MEIELDTVVTRDRDEDSGKFTEQYPENAFLEAIKRLDTATTTKIAEEVGCSYDLAYRRLNSLLSEEKVERKQVGPSFVWSTA
jgi:predicted HTH transcriptional regulator